MAGASSGMPFKKIPQSGLLEIQQRLRIFLQLGQEVHAGREFLLLLFVILCTISQENSLFQVLIALLVHGEINQLRRLHMKLRLCKKCDVQTITLLFQLRAGSMPRALF